MAQIDLTKYGITGTTEIVYNPAYETLFEEETKPELEGFDIGGLIRMVSIPSSFSAFRACEPE